MINPIVEVIARDVRYWTEGKAQRNADQHDLNGWCAIASAELWKQLNSKGIQSTICLSESVWGSHVFVMVDDHVVDVTATQFSEFKDKEIVIIHHKEADFEYHIHQREFESAKKLRNTQLREGWPANQVAFA